MNIQKQKKGFTLIELLMTVALIGVLLGIVIVSVDPVEQFANARNRQRSADTSLIALAIERYVSENDGNLPGGLDGTDKAICRASCLTDGSQVSLTVIQPYLAEGTVPIDPTEEDTTLTGYTIRVTQGTDVYVSAPNAENGETIGFGLEAAATGPFEVTNLPELELWLNAGSGLTVSDTGQVQLWEDLSGNRIEIVQPFESQQPQYIANAVNSQPAIRFDGVDDFMTGTGLDFRAEDNLTFILVTAALTNHNPGDWWRGGAFSQIFFDQTEEHGSVFLSVQQNQIDWYFGTGSWQPTPPSYTRPSSIGTNYTLTVLVRNSSSEDLYVDGAGPVLQYTPESEFLADARDSFLVGKTFGGNPFHEFHGDIAELIILKEALEPAQRLEITNYLMTKYGI